MTRIALIRTGSTDYDEQGRIAGTLDIPLCHEGAGQVARLVDDFANEQIKVVYTAPDRASQQTAEAVASALDIKVKVLDKLQNLDMGLWQGKLIDDVKLHQKKVFKQWQAHPETVCPPEGETLNVAEDRIAPVLAKVVKRHKDAAVALVAPEPLCSIVQSLLTDEEIGDLWAAESDCGSWQWIVARTTAKAG